MVAYGLGDLTDATGGGRTLTNVNGATVEAGKVGNATRFSAPSLQYLERASDSSLQTGNYDWGLALWVNLDTGGGGGGIVTRDAGPSAREFRLVNSGPSVAVLTLLGGSFASVSAAITTGWNFLLGWVDVAGATLNLKSNNGTTQSVALGTPNSPSTPPLRIGASAEVGSEAYFSGLVDAMVFFRPSVPIGPIIDPINTTLWNGGAGREYPFGSVAPVMQYLRRRRAG